MHPVSSAYRAPHGLLRSIGRVALAIAGSVMPVSAWANNQQGPQLPPGGLGPGVQQMWANICQAVPFCGKTAAAGGPVGVVLEFANRAVALIYPLTAVMAVLMIVYAGIKVVLSQGNDEGISSAKEVVKYALIGMLLAVGVREFLNFVLLVISKFV